MAAPTATPPARRITAEELAAMPSPPDVAFLSAARVPAGGVRAFLEGGADIIAEIVSPDDRASELPEKVAEYLDAGDALPGFAVPVAELFADLASLGGE